MRGGGRKWAKNWWIWGGIEWAIKVRKDGTRKMKEARKEAKKKESFLSKEGRKQRRKKESKDLMRKKWASKQVGWLIGWLIDWLMDGWMEGWTTEQHVIKTCIICLEGVGSQFLHRWKGHEQEIRKRSIPEINDERWRGDEPFFSSLEETFHFTCLLEMKPSLFTSCRVDQQPRRFYKHKP